MAPSIVRRSPGIDLRIRRQGRGDPEAASPRRHAIAGWPSAGRLARRRPPRPRTCHGPLPSGTSPAVPRAGPTARRTSSSARPDDDHDAGSSRDARRPPPRHEEPGTGERQTGDAHRPADDRDRPGGGDRPDRQPAAARHVSEPSPAASSCSNVFSPTSLRVRRSSTVANGASSRAAMILAAVTGPIPGSASSSELVARFRSTRPPAPPVRARRRSRRGTSGSASSREGTRTWSPSVRHRRQVQDLGGRSVSTRGPYPPAASTRSPTREPGGSS